MQKEWWLYVQKKSDTPEKVPSPQVVLRAPVVNNGINKTPSLIPAVSYIGLIFSGGILEIEPSVFKAVLGFIAFVTLLYYGYAVIPEILEYWLKRNQQKYDHTKSKRDADKDAMKMQQWKYDHEKEMKQMELDHEEKMKQLECQHEEKMKQLELDSNSVKTKNDVENSIPTANAAKSQSDDN